MTKAERSLFARMFPGGIPAVNAALVDQPQAASLPVPWLTEARAAQPAATTVPQAPAFTRTWKRGGSAVSKAGNPQTVFVTQTRNGGTFQCMVPADLVAAIRSNSV